MPLIHTPDLIKPQVGGITQNSAGTFFGGDPGGWLRQWEAPFPGRAYLVVMTGRSLAVWRQACTWEGQPRVAAMVAAVVPDDRHHVTVMSTWAHLLTQHYGDALAMVCARTHPGAIPWLKEQGVMLWARQQRDEARPVGQALPVRHLGWEMNDANRLEGLSQFQRLFSDNQIAVPCSRTLLELEGMTQDQAGNIQSAHGYGQDWLNGAAMAVLGLPSAMPLERTAYMVRPADYAQMGGQEGACEHESQGQGR